MRAAGLVAISTLACRGATPPTALADGVFEHAGRAVYRDLRDGGDGHRQRFTWELRVDRDHATLALRREDLAGADWQASAAATFRGTAAFRDGGLDVAVVERGGRGRRLELRCERRAEPVRERAPRSTSRARPTPAAAIASPGGRARRVRPGCGRARRRAYSQSTGVVAATS